MSRYTPPRIRLAREAIGREYEKQTGTASPMLPDVLAILTSPGILPLLENLIDTVKETDASFDNESMNPTPIPQADRDGNYFSKGPNNLY